MKRISTLLFLKSGNMLLCLLALSTAFGQVGQDQVTGTVTDQSGEALIGVNILVEGTNNGNSTDFNGKFTLQNVDLDSDILIISYVGYKTIRLPLAGENNLDITLESDTELLDEIVVVGYGTQSREVMTTSVSKLDKKVLENIAYPNIASAMQGTLSGVRVQTTTGQPGAAPRVIIRGGTSINNPNGAAPLYIVDGVIRSNLNGINQNDIESIEVLKDAAATAIYGARGSNGVVLVTSKSAKAGKAQISYNFDITSSNLGRQYDLVSGADFIKFFRMGVAATGELIPERLTFLTSASPAGTGNDLTNNTPYTTMYLSPENEYKLDEGWQSVEDPLDPTKTIIFKEEDWQDILFRTGISQNHYLSTSGGSQNASFNLGVGYLTNEGIAIGTNFNKLSLNMDGEVKLRDNINVFGRLMYSKTSQLGGSWPWERSQAAPPTMKYKFEDGTLSPGDYFPSPAYRISRQDPKNSTNNLTMIVGGKWDIFRGLSFNPQISLFDVSTANRNFQRSHFTRVGQFVDSRTASSNNTKNLQHQIDATLLYVNQINNQHNITGLLGYSYFENNYSFLSANGRGAATDLIPTLNAASEATNVGGIESEQIIYGYFSRVNYDFDQKILVSISGRYDGASNLGENNKWGFFPGVSLGWNLHKENFWNSSKSEAITKLKLRGSYGVNGNISGLGNYQSQGEYSVGSRYDGNAAIQNTILANNNLQWERSQTFDIGFDMGVFNNRGMILFDYYKRTTNQLLTNLELPHYTGFSNILTNLGSLENRGLELELNLGVIRKTNLQWDLSFNIATNKNKINRLPDNGVEKNRIGGINIWDDDKNTYAWVGGLQEGETIGNIYGYKQVSIYATDEEAKNGPLDLLIPLEDKTKYGGDVNWLDRDLNDTIDLRDRMYMGNIYPKWTGGITSYLGFKNFSFNVRLDYQLGHTIYNWSRALMLAQFGAFGSVTTEVLDSWQNQGDQTDVPRYYWADQQTRHNFAREGNPPTINSGNSRYYESGNYLAVREVSLSYNIPEALLDKINMDNLRLYVSGNNLHYFTKYKGLSPEEGGQDFGTYPIPRNVIFGLNISF